MNILITGCAGFIGSRICQKLLSENGHKIIGIDNFDLFYPKCIKQDNMSSFISNPNFIFHEIDITGKELLDNIFENNKIDAVIHLAAKAGVRNSSIYPLDFLKTNVYGTLNILECMKKYAIKKLVFSSSSSVYGNCTSEKFSEDMKNLKQLSIYALTKINAENYIELYSRLYGINAVCLRFFTVYGNRQRPDLAISKFTRQIKNNEVLTMYGDGSSYRDYTHVDDISDGIISALKYDKTSYEIINLGSENPIKLSDLISILEKLIGKKANIVSEPMPREDMVRTYADISKAKKLLNYEPKVKFDDGIVDIVKTIDL